MAVIETARLCRRNGVADIFAGLDDTDIQYLSSLSASGSTSSIASLTGAHALEVSDEDSSLNTEDSSYHESDDDHDVTTDYR